MLLILIVASVVRFIRVRRSDLAIYDKIELDWETLVETVIAECVEITKEETFETSSDDELDLALSRRRKTTRALKDCVFGIDSQKKVVIQLIYDIVAHNCKTLEEVLRVKDFSPEALDSRTKFEILMYFYQKDYGKDAFKQMVSEYDLDRVRYVIDGYKPSYMITDEDIDMIYAEKEIDMAYADMVMVIAILIYQEFKGFGVIDTIRSMNVNGVNIGSSGTVLAMDDTNNEFPLTRSVWVYFNGKQMHMRFLDMGSEAEMMRIVQLVIRWNQPGSLHEKRGYIVNTMYDKSRVCAVRPTLSESWAVYIRKFSPTKITPTMILNKEGIVNSQLPLNWTRYVILCQVTTGFTGPQGSGKTTYMSGSIDFSDPRKTIRVLEMAPELYFRENFPEYNILSLSETEYIKMETAQDILKKCDGQILFVGEVASAPVALRMVEGGQVGYEAVFFSHHGNTPDNMIYGLRNSCIQAGGFTDALIAEQQVVQVVKNNIRLNYTIEGERYLEYAVEIIPVPQAEDYPSLDRTDLEWSKAVAMREFFYRTTDRKTFKTNKLFHYDLATHTYIADNPPSPDLVKLMLSRLPISEQKVFLEWVASNWHLTNIKGA